MTRTQKGPLRCLLPPPLRGGGKRKEMEEDFFRSDLIYDACQSGDLDHVKRYLPLDCVNAVNPPTGMTFLNRACENQQSSIIEWLMDNGADVRCTDRDDRTCLEKLIVTDGPCYAKAVYALLSRSKERSWLVNRKGYQNHMLHAIDYAVYYQSREIVTIILKYGANPAHVTQHTRNLRPWFPRMLAGAQKCRTVATILWARQRVILGRSGNGADVARLIAQHVLATQWNKEWE